MTLEKFSLMSGPENLAFPNLIQSSGIEQRAVRRGDLKFRLWGRLFPSDMTYLLNESI